MEQAPKSEGTSSGTSALSAWLGTLTDAQLADFGAALHKERRLREEAGYRAKGICPECGGCGYEGNEMDGHTRCSRCNTTGEYVPNVAIEGPEQAQLANGPAQMEGSTP